AFFILMVPRRGNTRNHAVDPSPRPEPLTPLSIMICAVDKVARVDNKPCFGSVGVGSANDPRPERFDVVLRVPEVDKGERLHFVAGGAEVKPLAPVRPIPDSISILCVGRQSAEIDA